MAAMLSRSRRRGAVLHAARAEIGDVAGLTIAVDACMSMVGGGTMPTAELASWAITLRVAPPMRWIDSHAARAGYRADRSG